MCGVREYDACCVCSTCVACVERICHVWVFCVSGCVIHVVCLYVCICSVCGMLAVYR